jgi:hypothetical protein
MAEQSKKPILLNSLHLPGYSIIFFCAYFYCSLIRCNSARMQQVMRNFHLIFFALPAADETT